MKTAKNLTNFSKKMESFIILKRLITVKNVHLSEILQRAKQFTAQRHGDETALFLHSKFELLFREVSKEKFYRQALTQSRTDICVDFDPGTSSKCPRTISLITECLSFTASVLR